MPAPIATQTSATKTSVTNSVSPSIEPKPGGSISTTSAVCAAAWVTMKPMRKPAPVRVTTPTTMPTAAAAAPTASA